MRITKQHRLFIEAYDGNPARAMREAGFEGTDKELEKEGNLLLQSPLIIEAIRQRSLYSASTAKVIATRDERQAFWTSVMRNEDPHALPEYNDKGVTKAPSNIPLAVRLKASELLGKSETDFVEKLNLNHNVSITDVIQKSYSIEADNIEAIEAQYEVLHARKQEKTQQDTNEFKELMVASAPDSDESVRDTLCESSLDDFL